ncbi:galactokinase [Sorangium cellulosum]|uniref:Galactokinase n=1 Tax=Sorangium cellulosum TaxID=56 RepID=A0A4P2Q5Y6_SORCE|nr:galactokinase [Sorangium cellulosum]AUX24506.1 galactokinase [Sorangium cellulosum]
MSGGAAEGGAGGARAYEAVFGAAPAVRESAPGRVNLLGEHTDYNDGFVMPTAIPQRTTVALGPSPDGRHHLYAADLDERATLSAGGAADEPAPPGFARYLLGCIRLFEREGFAVPPLCVHVSSRVPMGAGLSSSAALEVAALRALRSFTGVALSDERIAELGQRAEIEFAGVNCGIMDQMASSLADARHLLFLDTRTLARRLLPLPAGAEILVIDSGVARTLASSGYNERRAECEEAARRLGARALRDVPDPAAAAALPEPLSRRARHVITENRRVLEAAEGLSAGAFGERMNASHASLRDDYEVSVPALDALVALLQATPGVFGARLTGAGFGGACVALVASGQAAAIGESVCREYDAAGQRGRVLVPERGV